MFWEREEGGTVSGWPFFMAVAVLFAVMLKAGEGLNMAHLSLRAVHSARRCLVILYAEKIYPRLKPEFGGGHPIHVVLYFADKSGPPPASNSQLEGKLIDETEQGYYVQPMTSSIVYFVSRARSLVQFAREVQPLFERATRPKG